MTDAALLEFISRQPHGRTTLKHLFRELGSRGENRRELESALDRLAGKGEVIELRNGHYAAAARSREGRGSVPPTPSTSRIVPSTSAGPIAGSRGWPGTGGVSQE